MRTGDEIAIVGMAGRFPGAPNVATFWDNLLSGRNVLLPDGALGTHDDRVPHQVETASLLDGADAFDAAFFGVSPKEATITDPQHRVFLEVALEAIEDAGISLSSGANSIGVYAGANFSDYYQGQGDPPELINVLPDIIGADKDFLATRVAYKLNLGGPAITVQCACSTSMVGVHLACQALLAGECDAAIAGGVSITSPRRASYLYLPGGMLSPDGLCRAFEAEAKGTVFSEGAGAVVLMRLEEALAQGHQVYALIVGSAVTNDGAGKSGFTAPSADGQIRVLKQALSVARVEPSQISYIEAHGTGTVLGDAVELSALNRVFASLPVGSCLLGSVKTNVGHLTSAAGVAGLIKTALALKHGVLPATLNFDTPNPDFDLKTSPFRVVTQTTPWTSSGVRRAGVSSFGLGGANAHVVLEQAPDDEARCPSAIGWHPLVLWGKSPEALDASRLALSNCLETHPDIGLADVAFTLAEGRTRYDHAYSTTVSSVPHAIAILRGSGTYQRTTGEPPKIAFLFPGQGAQYLGMANQLYKALPLFRDTVNDLIAGIPEQLRGTLEEAVFDRKEVDPQLLQSTEVAQPALFAVCYSLSKVLAAWGLTPGAVIGHSIGEYVAASVAGVLSPEDALRLVIRRGQLMQGMTAGGMISVALPEDELQRILPRGLDCAAVNSPMQCVVSGPFDELQRFQSALSEREVRFRALRTSHAFHSRMMEPMLDEFAKLAGSVDLGAPVVPYVSNVTGQLMTGADLRDKSYFAKHVRLPVRFDRGLQTIAEIGCNILVEVGPGQSLSALAKQNLGGAGATVVHTMAPPPDDSDALPTLVRALGSVAAAGVRVDWRRYYQGERLRRVSLPAYPFDRKIFTAPARSRKGLATITEKRPMDEWFAVPRWSSRAGDVTGEDAPAAERCTIALCDDAGRADRILDAQSEYATAMRVYRGEAFAVLSRSSYLIDGADASFDELFDAISISPDIPIRILFFWSLIDRSRASLSGSLTARFRARHEAGAFALLSLVAALRRRSLLNHVCIDVVSTGALDVSGTETLDPLQGAFVALCKVLPLDNPGLQCRLLDVDRQTLNSDPAAIRRHLSAPGKAAVVALRNGRIWTQDYEELPLPSGSTAARLRTGGVYLISGGLGEVGLIIGRHLAERWKAKLVLLGRTALPEKAVWGRAAVSDETPANCRARIRALLELEALGAEVEYFSADCADMRVVRDVRRQVRARFGEINGVVHAAGVLTADQVHEGSFADFDIHLAGKAQGLEVLQTVFARDKLDFGLVISSLSAVLGGVGYRAYATANCVADLLVLKCRRSGSDSWVTSNWDLWRTDLTAGLATTGALRTAILAAEGQEAFERVLSTKFIPQIIVSTRSVAAQQEHIASRRRATSETSDHRRVSHVAAVGGPPAGPVEEKLAEIWQVALGVDGIGREDDFFELGGDSLLAVNIFAEVHEIFGVEMELAEALEVPTLVGMAGALDKLIGRKAMSGDMRLDYAEAALAR